MFVAAVGKALPPHHYDRETMLESLGRVWRDRLGNPEHLRELHQNAAVEGRYLALPLEEWEGLQTFGESNDAWIAAAQDLGAEAIEAALAGAGLTAADIAAFLSVTVTGVAAPTIDARLMNRLDFSPHVKRIPVFGLGCVAGAAGIARAADYVRGFPDQVALLLSVELCSLTRQRDDTSVASLVASALFGDGAAAALLVGDQHPRAADLRGRAPRVVATKSTFYRDTEHIMGWEISETGFRIVLSADVPRIVQEHLRGDIEGFLAEHGLEVADVAHWICHPGGPKVLDALQASLDLPPDALARTWRGLRTLGNLSSTSVLFVLGEVLADERPAPGSHGMMLALGPGFCSELVLLRW